MKTNLLRHFAFGAFLVLGAMPAQGQPYDQYDIYAFDQATGATNHVTHIPDRGEFNPSWSPDGRRIVHDVVAFDDVSLKVYDLLGRVVATLVQGHREAGTHAVRFDAAHLPTGTYLYRLQAGAHALTRQVVLVR